MSATTSRRSRWVVTLGVTAVLLGATVALSAAIGTPETPWGDGEERGRFRAVFDGYGTIRGDDEQIVLEPRAAAEPDVTHGGLVITKESYENVELEVDVQTQRQVREGEPNPWEAGWVLWNYTDNDHFYAVALKPNGWEISKQDPAYPGKQRFLSSGSDPQFPVGTKNTVNVEHRGAEMTVSVNGQVLDTVVDNERPYRQGAVGLYTEDARVRFTDLDATGSEATGPDTPGVDRSRLGAAGPHGTGRR